MANITPASVADELGLELAQVPREARGPLLKAIAQLAMKHASEERKRCQKLCARRVRLWRNVKGGGTPLAEEARSRANEAQYIADLIVGNSLSDDVTH